MKKIAMIMMGCSLLTLLSFQLPTEEQSVEEYMPIDTTLGGLELETDLKEVDFDTEAF